MKFSIFLMFINTVHFRKFTTFNVSLYLFICNKIMCGLLMLVEFHFEFLKVYVMAKLKRKVQGLKGFVLNALSFSLKLKSMF